VEINKTNATKNGGLWIREFNGENIDDTFYEEGLQAVSLPKVC